MSEAEYYVMKCPFCDNDITSALETPHSIIHCPHCDKLLHLYSVFGYNMWLSENGKTKKVNKKPVKDVIIEEEPKGTYDGFSYMEYEEYDEDEEAERCLENGELLKKHPKVIHEILSFNADLCLMQHNYLTRLGFTRDEASEIVMKLIEQGFIL